MASNLRRQQAARPCRLVSRLIVQRCAVSLPRRRARAKNPEKAENSENAMREGDSIVCIVPPLPSGLLHSRGSRTSIRKLLTIWEQKSYG